MGSVGSGVAGEQEFAMKSVGTRTTLPRIAPHHLPRRSHSAERVPPPLLAPLVHPSSEGTEAGTEVGTEGGSSDGRSSSATSDRPPPTTSLESSSVLTSPPMERADRAFREVHRGVLALDLCGNVVAAAAATIANDKSAHRVRMVTGHAPHSRDASANANSAAIAHAHAAASASAAAAMAAANNHKPKLKPKPKTEKTAPKLTPVSEKMEHVREKQRDSGLVRPSAFKPVVPKSFHSMQNLVGQAGGGGGGGGRGGAERGERGGDSSNIPQPLRECDSPTGNNSGSGSGGGGCGGGQSGMSDSGSNSLSSLPTYTSSGPPALGPLSASTSHLNRVPFSSSSSSGGGAPAPPIASTSVGTNTAGGATGGVPLEKPSYHQNGVAVVGVGVNVTDGGRVAAAGKNAAAYHQRLCHQVDIPATVRPSPSSDDIIQDLEDRLWEKEQEVLHMRRNLDQSEAAIVQVFEEKQRVWEREMEDLRQNYAGRLQQVTRRAQRSQQALQSHVTRLQQDKARLQDEMASLLAQREDLERKCLDYRKEQADILPRLEETKWEVCQKVGEISLLKQQLRESQGEVTQRAGEMLSLRGQLKELTAQLKQQEEAVLGLRESYNTKSLELKRCEAQLQRTLAEVSMLRDKLLVFEAEVLGLRRALGDLHHPDSHTGNLSAGSHWASLPCRSPSDGGLAPLTSLPALQLSLPPSEALLSLQSDEAKAQRREAGDLRRQLERLQEELRTERQQRERQALTFAQERHTWKDEKERVLKYQAQLQLSYVETLQKNQALERRVGQLGQRLTSSSSSSPCPSPGSPTTATTTTVSSTTTTTTTPTPPTPTPITILQPPPLLLSPPPSLPTPEELKLPPSLHQLAPPWPGPTRLERIESTEI